MDHLDRDDLILLHYGETASPGAREHLFGCEECRRESALLRRVLDAVDEAGVAPELAPAWEEQLWNRLRWKLERRRSPRFAWIAAAAAAILVLAVIAGYQLRSPAVKQPIAAVTTAEGRERVLLVVLGDHLSRSERVLTEVKNATADAPSVFIADREAMDDLVRKNRLYLDAAYASGQTSLASVLEEMQPLLLELARAPEHPSAQDIEMLQRRIEKRGAVLKLRVAGQQIRQSL